MIGVAGQKRVPEDWLLDFPIAVTDVARQRLISDLLGTETARIDALIEKKRRLISLAGEQIEARVELELRAAGEHQHNARPAKQCDSVRCPLSHTPERTTINGPQNRVRQRLLRERDR